MNMTDDYKIAGNIRVYGSALVDIQWLKGHQWNGVEIILDKHYYVNINGQKIMIFDHIWSDYVKNDEYGIPQPATIWNMTELRGCWGQIDIDQLAKLIARV